MLARIAQVIGIPGLEKYMGITRTIKKFESPEAFIKAWKTQDANQAKNGIATGIKEGLNDLNNARETFAQNWKEYKLHLNSGREIQYTDEVYKRTMMVFAETKQELDQMLNSVNQSKTLAELANALFGRQLKAIR